MELFEAIQTLIFLIIIFIVETALIFGVLFMVITDEGKKNKFLGLVLAFIASVVIFWMWGSQFPGWDRSIGKISYLFT